MIKTQIPTSFLHMYWRRTRARLSISIFDPFSQAPRASSTGIADVEGQSTRTAKRFEAPFTHPAIPFQLLSPFLPRLPSLALSSQVEFSDLLQLQFSRGARAYAPLQPPVRNSEEVKRPEYISYAKPVSGVLLRTKPKALNLCKVSMGLLLRICPAAPEILENL